MKEKKKKKPAYHQVCRAPDVVVRCGCHSFPARPFLHLHPTLWGDDVVTLDGEPGRTVSLCFPRPLVILVRSGLAIALLEKEIKLLLLRILSETENKS